MHFNGSAYIIKGHGKKNKQETYIVYNCARVGILVHYFVKLLIKASEQKICSTVDLPMLFL